MLCYVIDAEAILLGSPSVPELSVDWVDPWVGLGWVGLGPL